MADRQLQEIRKNMNSQVMIDTMQAIINNRQSDSDTEDSFDFPGPITSSEKNENDESNYEIERYTPVLIRKQSTDVFNETRNNFYKEIEASKMTE